MKSLLNFRSFAILATVALLLSGSCQTSTTDPTTESVRESARSQKSANAQNSSDATSEDTDHGLKLLPVDEGNKEPSFHSFRSQLLAAVKAHDHDFILGVLDPGIENGHDIEAGVKEFRRKWMAEDPESSVWDVLLSILTGGGSFSERDGQREFCGPYVVSQWPNIVKQLPKGTDSLDYVAITGKDVGVHLEPKLTAPVVVRLSYDVVRAFPNAQVIERSNPQFSSWVKIKTPNGQEGYVPDSDVQGPMDYGACFKQRSGKWVMSKLAASE